MKKLFLFLLGFTVAIVASAEPADPTAGDITVVYNILLGS